MLRRFELASKGVNLIALAMGLGLLLWNPWLAFLPMAAWVGWFQAGSL